MSLRRIVIGLATLGLASGFFSSPAAAQLNRTAVSVLGVDANNCAVVTPCRSFAHGTMESWQNNKVRGNFVDFGSGSGGVLTKVSQQ